jgi:DNA invertase Pin-like site-specific DNA recombinase
VEHGVKNQTVAAGLWDLSTSTGQMTAKIIGSVDQQESAVKAERITRARQRKAKKGALSGGARPYGYTKDSTALVPEEATEIKTAVEAVVRGASLRSLVRDLNTRGVTTGPARSGPPSNSRTSSCRRASPVYPPTTAWLSLR